MAENYPIRKLYAQGFMARRNELRQRYGIRLEEKTLFIGIHGFIKYNYVFLVLR